MMCCAPYGIDLANLRLDDVERLAEIIGWCDGNIGAVLDRWAPPDPGSLWREDRRCWRFASPEDRMMFAMVWQ